MRKSSDCFCIFPDNFCLLSLTYDNLEAKHNCSHTQEVYIYIYIQFYIHFFIPLIWVMYQKPSDPRTCSEQATGHTGEEKTNEHPFEKNSAESSSRRAAICLGQLGVWGGNLERTDEERRQQTMQHRTATLGSDNCRHAAPETHTPAEGAARQQSMKEETGHGVNGMQQWHINACSTILWRQANYKRCVHVHTQQSSGFLVSSLHTKLTVCCLDLKMVPRNEHLLSH